MDSRSHSLSVRPRNTCTCTDEGHKWTRCPLASAFPNSVELTSSGGHTDSVINGRREHCTAHRQVIDSTESAKKILHILPLDPLSLPLFQSPPHLVSSSPPCGHKVYNHRDTSSQRAQNFPSLWCWRSFTEKASSIRKREASSAAA